MFYWTAYYILKFLSKIFLPFRVYGLENIPAQGAFLFTSNHVSNLDPLLLGMSIPRKISYMAKDSLFKNKVLGFILRKGNAFSVKRGTSDIGAMKEALKRLKSGSPLLLFPEGTRTLDITKRKIQPGVGFLAAKSRAPVVPVKIIGSDKALPAGSKWIKRHPIKIVIGKAITFDNKYSYSQIAFQIIEAVDSISVPA